MMDLEPMSLRAASRDILAGTLVLAVLGLPTWALVAVVRAYPGVAEGALLAACGVLLAWALGGLAMLWAQCCGRQALARIGFPGPLERERAERDAWVRRQIGAMDLEDAPAPGLGGERAEGTR